MNIQLTLIIDIIIIISHQRPAKDIQLTCCSSGVSWWKSSGVMMSTPGRFMARSCWMGVELGVEPEALAAMLGWSTLDAWLTPGEAPVLGAGRATCDAGWTSCDAGCWPSGRCP
ncbi:hypothetical protein ACOMHN_060429 [Nucella lapillus]